GPDMALARRIGRLYATIADGAACRLVVLTLGSQGAAVFEPGLARLVPAPHVDPVDTTGAGDAFVGVFLALWLNGATAIEAARRATIAAGLAALGGGAQGRQLTAEELDRRAERLEYPDDAGAAPAPSGSLAGFDLLAGAA